MPQNLPGKNDCQAGGCYCNYCLVRCRLTASDKPQSTGNMLVAQSARQGIWMYKQYIVETVGKRRECYLRRGQLFKISEDICPPRGERLNTLLSFCSNQTLGFFFIILFPVRIKHRMLWITKCALPSPHRGCSSSRTLLRNSVSSRHNASVSSAAPPLSEVTTSPQPQRTTTTTTTTTAHRGVTNTTITTGLKQGSRGAPRPPPVIPQTTSPPPPESFPLPERFCKATEERDIMWPQTPRGMLVERPCPKGTRGKQGSFSPQGRVLADFNMAWASQESVPELAPHCVIVAYTRILLCKESAGIRTKSAKTRIMALSCVTPGRKT